MLRFLRTKLATLRAARAAKKAHDYLAGTNDNRVLAGITIVCRAERVSLEALRDAENSVDTAMRQAAGQANLAILQLEAARFTKVAIEKAIEARILQQG
jgi:hypothetical protein